jgi:hypothetical protein
MESHTGVQVLAWELHVEMKIENYNFAAAVDWLGCTHCFKVIALSTVEVLQLGLRDSN